MKYRFTFMVGVFDPVRIRINAADRDNARERAWRCMDLLHERADTEPPVGYDLSIVSMERLL